METMGSLWASKAYFHALNKESVGWLARENIVNATRSGNYTLRSMEAPVALGRMSLRIALPAPYPVRTPYWNQPVRFYFIEQHAYPGLVSPASGRPVHSGVFLRLGNGKDMYGYNSPSYLLKRFLSAPGERFVDSYHGINVTLLQFSRNRVVLNVSLRPK